VSESIAMAERNGETLPDIEVTKVVDGLGMDYGTGTISAAAQEAKPGNEDLAELTDQAIASPNILVPISSDENGDQLQDDGCGDGRGIVQRSGAIFTKDGKEFKRSLNRSKVFGGGMVMAAAARIGLGKAKGLTAKQNIEGAIDDLNDRGVDFGAHTDNHAHGELSGCGAIDRHPVILQAAVQFEEQIANTIADLDVDTTGIEEVQQNFRTYAQEVAGQPYSGREAKDSVVANGKIVKELADAHLETRVLLNLVEGFTVDQGYVRDVTGGRAQVFAVDVPRIVEIADSLYDDPSDRHKAILSELVYTLATAAVLTKGDLPVYKIAEAK